MPVSPFPIRKYRYMLTAAFEVLAGIKDKAVMEPFPANLRDEGHALLLLPGQKE